MEGAGGGEGGGAITVQEAVPVAGSSPTKDLPWSRCIMGCVPSRVEGEEGSGRELVMMLPCLHMLCSKTCVVKFLAEHKDEAVSGAHISCSKCQCRVTREQLSNWLNLEREFSGGSPKQKEVELICALCIFDKVATAYCPDCPSPGTLCDACVLVHPQIRATQKHVIKHDLSELKKSSGTCQRHREERFTHACLTCRETLCEDCVKEHDREHKVTGIQAEKQQLLEKIQLARQVKDKFEAARTELGKKREDLNSRQWNKLMNGIRDQFEEMRRILTERENEIKTEARKHFSTESQALDFKRQDIEKAKSSTDQFIKTGEILLNDQDDMASINYLRRTESYIQWLLEMEGTSIESFAREDFHVELDTTANIQVQKAVQEYCKVSYPKDQPSEPRRVVLTEILTAARAEPSRSGNAPDDVEETESARCNMEAGSVSDDGREVQNLTPSSPSCPDVQTAAAPTEMTSASSSSTTTLSPTVRESGEEIMTVKQELMEEMPVSDGEMEANDEEPSDPGTDDTMQISSTSASSLETPSDSELNAPNGESATLNLDMETTTEMESDMPEDEPTTPPQTVNGAREKRQRKKSSHPDFIDWSAIQMNNVPANQLHQTEPGSRHQRRILSGPSEIGAPESVLQPMIPEAAPDNRKRQRRQKRKYFDYVNSNDDCDGGTQSTFEASYMKEVMEKEGGSGYISAPEVNGGAITIRRRSIRVRRKSQPGGEDDHDRASEMPGVESLNGASSSSGPGPSVGRRQRGRPVADEPSASFPAAPMSSLEKNPFTTSVSILSPNMTRGADADLSDDYCFICMDGGAVVCCDNCPKVFHLGCHIPVLTSQPAEDVTWKCNYCTIKRTIDKEILKYPESSGNAELTEANQRHFIIACKFLMECYKIPEIPTMRWRFPKGYLKQFGKVPYNLQCIKDRLCLGEPEPFGSVEEMMQAFKQMFTQAFVYLEKHDVKHLPYAESYFGKVLSLVTAYYPAHGELFNGVLKEKKK